MNTLRILLGTEIVLELVNIGVAISLVVLELKTDCENFTEVSITKLLDILYTYTYILYHI